MVDIIKTVIPAAGLGTRFLPLTKSVPKEMLPLFNKPAIQHLVEEALGSAIQSILTITSRNKEALNNYFDIASELEVFLKERNLPSETLTQLNKIINTLTFSYIRQAEPLGLGHAIWLARHYIVEKEYFGVMLPDDIFISKTPALSQLIKIARQERASVIAVQEVPAYTCSSYGMVGIKKQITPNLFQVSHLIEKPDQKESPSNLAIVGRYVLSSKIFNALETIEVDAKGELQLTDAISTMAHSNEKVFAFKVQGTRYDIGTPLGWIKALVELGLNDSTFAPHLKKIFLEQQEKENILASVQRPLEVSL